MRLGKKIIGNPGNVLEIGYWVPENESELEGLKNNLVRVNLFDERYELHFGDSLLGNDNLALLTRVRLAPSRLKSHDFASYYRFIFQRYEVAEADGFDEQVFTPVNYIDSVGVTSCESAPLQFGNGVVFDRKSINFYSTQRIDSSCTLHQLLVKKNVWKEPQTEMLMRRLE